jgi:hydroxymethylpyrimidine pyrophosphatase-like HAD family hydrolase
VFEAVSLRCVYVDLDGTLLGARASLFHDGDGRPTMDGVRAVEACLRADVEICIFSGRRQAQVLEDARLLGQDSYIFEVGSGLVVGDNESPEWLTGGLVPDERGNIYQQIEAAGVPTMLLERYSDQLEYHAPWHRDRDVSHLFRGWIDTADVDDFLAAEGHEHLRLVDNGRIRRRSERLRFEHLHAYHLIPKVASKAGAVARHMQIRGYARDEVIACGDSREDMEVAPVVGEFFLMRNAVIANPELEALAAAAANVSVTEATHGSGVYEAVVSRMVIR